MTNIFEDLKANYDIYPYNTQFVIQEHNATSFHFDLRIKKGNVAPSWAIPKAKLPTKTYERYLAVRTSDHPLSFMRFSGVIPNNQYGAGTVQIYDYGECIVYTWHDNYIVVKLMGEKTQGFYALIRMKKDQWLITYMNQEKAKSIYEDNNVLEGAVLEEVPSNTKFSMCKESNQEHILCVEEQTEFVCNLNEDSSLSEYIENTFNISPASIHIVDEDVTHICFDDLIEEHIQSIYKVCISDNIILKENFTWIEPTNSIEDHLSES